MVHSYRQARRGHHRPAGDALDDLIVVNLRQYTTARRLWKHFCGLAVIRRSTCIVEADVDTMTIQPNPASDSEKLRTVSWRAFEVRVSRARMRLADEASRPVAAIDPLDECLRAWLRPTYQDQQTAPAPASVLVAPGS